MSPNAIYNQGYFNALNNMGTISELCPFKYTTTQFKLWINGYSRGLDTREKREKEAKRPWIKVDFYSNWR